MCNCITETKSNLSQTIVQATTSSTWFRTRAKLILNVRERLLSGALLSLPNSFIIIRRKKKKQQVFGNRWRIDVIWWFMILIQLLLLLLFRFSPWFHWSSTANDKSTRFQNELFRFSLTLSIYSSLIKTFRHKLQNFG